MGMTSEKIKNSITIDDGAQDVFNVTHSLRQVILKASVHEGIARGIREAIRAIEQGTAQLCILAAACDDPNYGKVVEALCQEHNVNTIMVKDAAELGEWVGLGRKTVQGINKTTKIGCCRCAVITDFGEQSEGLSHLQAYLNNKTEESLRDKENALP